MTTLRSGLFGSGTVGRAAVSQRDPPRAGEATPPASPDGSPVWTLGRALSVPPLAIGLFFVLVWPGVLKLVAMLFVAGLAAATWSRVTWQRVVGAAIVLTVLAGMGALAILAGGVGT